jgi:hypothetical protein
MHPFSLCARNVGRSWVGVDSGHPDQRLEALLKFTVRVEPLGALDDLSPIHAPAELLGDFLRRSVDDIHAMDLLQSGHIDPRHEMNN